MKTDLRSVCAGVQSLCTASNRGLPTTGTRDMPADGFVPGNRLLAALPPEVLQQLAPELETAPIRNGDVVQPIGRPAEHVYFPHSGMGSMMIHMKRSVNVEAATIGN